MKHGLPEWLRDKLRNPPKAGAGIHGWLFAVARQLHAHMSEAQMVEALRIATMRCDRRVSIREINDAVANSKGVAWTAREMVDQDPDVPAGSIIAQDDAGSVVSYRTAEAWPKVSQVARERALQDGRQQVTSLADLWEQSPVVPDPHTIDARVLVDVLFRQILRIEDPWVCVAKDHPSQAVTRRLSKLPDLGSHSFIVPSPMSKSIGARKDGRPSARCLGNTGPRRYLVVEFDDGDGKDVHASLLWHLHRVSKGTGGPKLVLAVDSAGKSLHGWYEVLDRTEEELREWMAYAVQIGADPATWTRCQLVRMPEGTRAGVPQGGTFPEGVLPEGWSDSEVTHPGIRQSSRQATYFIDL